MPNLPADQDFKHKVKAKSYRVAERTVFPSKRLVSGRQELTVAVRDDVLGRAK